MTTMLFPKKSGWPDFILETLLAVGAAAADPTDNRGNEVALNWNRTRPWRQKIRNPRRRRPRSQKHKPEASQNDESLCRGRVFSQPDASTEGLAPWHL